MALCILHWFFASTERDDLKKQVADITKTNQQVQARTKDNEALRKKQRDVPLAIVHGENDGIVGFGMGEYAYNAFVDDSFSAIRLFKHKTAAHMFAVLPVDEAIAWLDGMTTREGICGRGAGVYLGTVPLGRVALGGPALGIVARGIDPRGISTEPFSRVSRGCVRTVLGSSRLADGCNVGG